MAQGRRGAKLALIVIVLLLGTAGIVTWGIQARIKTAAAVKQQTLELAVPTVSVVRPKRGAMKDEVVLPGNIQAFTDSPIYARASGYLKEWKVDIGARVKTGQVLAEIDAPELDQQVRQADAALAQSRAALEQARAMHELGRTNEELARVTAQRWANLVAKGAVSRQENDQYQAQYQAQAANVQALEKAINAAQSTVSSEEANLARLGELQGYKVVKAPFDGVITARNTDVGALVNAGNGGPAQELFHMASTATLRVFVRLPQVYSRSAVPGVTADLVLSEFPGRRFTGKLVRTSEAIDPATRTLLTEVDVDNRSGALLPGAYAAVHLKLPSAAPSLILPVNALLFRSEGLQVGVVSPEGRVELVSVILGKDYGTEVEVVSGISESDRVIVNPPDSLTSGVTVRVAETEGR
ncbi:Efflux transporter, RND family, MFP subunit [Candidatus Sulfopaludibacter sp. SbA4]|nr:Efflux transporter, RND family, MFP subunit [Candidatus Sulfopaludibacter sp. SbA4]